MATVKAQEMQATKSKVERALYRLAKDGNWDNFQKLGAFINENPEIEAQADMAEELAPPKANKKYPAEYYQKLRKLREEFAPIASDTDDDNLED